MESLHVRLDTPLWTGNATKESCHVEPSGLVGTLRWWYEVIIRGCDGWACDPSDPDTRCQLDGDVFANMLKRGCDHAGPGVLCPDCRLEALAAGGLCPACQLFGATGWAKRVHLSVVETDLTSARPFYLTHDQVRADRSGREGKPPRYFFPPGLVGEMELRMLPREPGDRASISLILGLLALLQRRAALGAKTNLGYGLFHTVAAPPDARAFADLVRRRAAVGRTGPDRGYPDLRELFFVELPLTTLMEAQHFVNVKYDLRQAFRKGEVIQRLVPDRRLRGDLRHFLLGATQTTPNEASKIKMAVTPDGSALRVWGWVPRSLPGGASRAGVMDLIHRTLDRLTPDALPEAPFHLAEDGCDYLVNLMGGKR